MDIIERKDICEKVSSLTSEIAEFIRHERENFTTDKIEYKGHNNMVSYVDKTSEAMIVKVLKAILPESDIIAEEGKYEEKFYRYRWVIDPLDGTTNFIHGFPPYCISIALQEDNKTILGVIREVTTGDLYHAWGEGTFYNNRTCHVSATGRLEDSLVITGLAYNMSEGQKKDFVTLFDYFNRNTHGARRTGSAAMNLAYIARGIADVFYQANLSPWDVAAGGYLIEQADGVVTDFNGTNNYIFGRTIIASNRNLYNDIKTIVTK